ncbi:PAS domain S-box protein [Sphingomonas sp.]|uniref:PAS domain S-box protein n=1 Tax=Sphingomonas sp. TaxID=28214 RepID=UPI001B11343A|nr:PAS domain S-box protein [Sphingomonas sp.]MBO9713575.1 PAS domain S-box protein [Sphingomonas sp.]
MAEALLVALVFGALASISTVLTLDTAHIAALWFPNGVLLAALLWRRGEHLWLYVLLCMIANVTAGIAAGGVPWRAAGLSACNMFEVTLAALVLLGRARRVPDLGTPSDLLRFVGIAGVFAPVFTGVVAAIMVADPSPSSFVTTWAAWALTDGLGNLMITPILLVLAKALQTRTRVTRHDVIHWTAILGTGTLLTLAVFSQQRYPMLFAAAPFVLLAGFRLGISGAAVSTLIVTAIASIATGLDHGPIHIVQGPLREKIFVLQVFLLTTFASSLPLAAAVRELRGTREALAQGRDLLRSTLDTIREVVFRTDAEGHWTLLNPAWTELTGYPVEQSLGRNWREWLASEVQEGADSILEPLRTGERDHMRFDLPFVRADGVPRIAEVSIRPMHAPDGTYTGMSGNLRDVTDQRADARALVESEHHLQLFASNVSDAVFRLALDGTCLFVTPSVRDVFGYEPEHVVGRNMLARFHPDDRGMVSEGFGRMAMGQLDRAVITYRARHAVREGWVWIEASSQLVREAVTGKPLEIVSSLRDISARKALEAELERERERAESAALAKSRFLANMSHELRTPMNGVLGFADLLLDGNLPDDERDYARLIAESSRAMMRILNEILDLSKIEAGQMAIIDESVELPHALMRSVELFEAVAKQKGIALSVALAPDLPRWIHGDGLRLRQVVTNLVGNAVKFTNEGSVQVEAKADYAGFEPRLLVSVRDTGIGIAPERQEMIFAEFVQADEETARNFGGTGLGLSIADRLVHLMGGEMTLESELRKGSCFTLILPLVEAEAPAPAPADAPETPETGPMAARVLVAEDNAINQHLVRAVLRQLGVECEIAADGTEAIAAVLAAEAEGRGYDLVLMDLQMPETDGFEAVRRIREVGIAPEQLPVVALTANAYQEDIQAALLAGMQGHLAKPIDITALTRMLRRWVRIPAVAMAPNLDPALAELRPQFRARMVTLEAMLAAAVDAGDDHDWNDIRGHSHQLAGTAAMFGYRTLGDAARIVDRYIFEEAQDGAFAASLAFLRARLNEALAAEG